MHFLDLPDLIFWNIISYLKVGERIFLSQLSERLRLCVKTSHKGVYDFEYQNAISKKEVIKYIKDNSEEILKVNINSCILLNNVPTYNAICQCPNLTDFSSLYINISSRNLIKILEKAPNLRSLSIQIDTPLNQFDFTHKCLEVLQNLRHFTIFIAGLRNVFSLYQSDYISTSTMCFWDFFSKLHTLTFKITNYDNPTCFHFPKYCDELKTLTLDCPLKNKPDPLFYRYFLVSRKFTCFSQTNLLDSIRSKRCIIVTLELDKQNLRLAALSCELISLQNLCLSDCTIITRANAVSFPFPQLTTLSISKIKSAYITDLTVVCNGLQCPKLTEFSIINYKVEFKDESDLQNLLNNLKGLTCLKLPAFFYTSIGKSHLLRTYQDRVSHHKKCLEVSVTRRSILQQITTNNPHLRLLTLPSSFARNVFAEVINLYYLTHFTFDSNYKVTGDLLLTMAERSPYLSHLSILNISISFAAYFFKDILSRFKSLIYLKFESYDQVLPLNETLMGASKLVFAIFSYEYMTNALDANKRLKEMVAKHPTLTYLVFISPKFFGKYEMKVISKPGAIILRIPLSWVSFYPSIINGKV